MKPNLVKTDTKKATQQATKRSNGAHSAAKKVVSKTDAGTVKNLYIAELIPFLIQK
jgi:hypothetical protein